MKVCWSKSLHVFGSLEIDFAKWLLKWISETVSHLWWELSNDIDRLLLIYDDLVEEDGKDVRLMSWVGTWENDVDAVLVNAFINLSKVVQDETEFSRTMTTLRMVFLLISKQKYSIHWLNKRLFFCGREKIFGHDILFLQMTRECHVGTNQFSNDWESTYLPQPCKANISLFSSLSVNIVKESTASRILSFLKH